MLQGMPDYFGTVPMETVDKNVQQIVTCRTLFPRDSVLVAHEK
jgi:hypothetical protein